MLRTTLPDRIFQPPAASAGGDGTGRRRRLPVAGLCVALILGLLPSSPASADAGPVSQAVERRSVDGLIYDLQHPEAARRIQAARALGENRIERAVPALVETIDDPDPRVREEVAWALVEIDDPRALDAYVELTADPVPGIQKKAIEGIVDLYVEEEGGVVRNLAKVADFLNPFRDDYDPRLVEPWIEVDAGAVDALANLLRDDDEDVREEAAVALGILRAERALPRIEEVLLEDPSDDVRVELIRALYKIDEPAAGDVLIPLIGDPDKEVHDEAIFTIGRLGVEEAVPTLVDWYRSGYEERRRILGILPVSGGDDFQRRILEALAQLGDPRAEEIFVEALGDERAYYRRYGAEGLGRVGNREHADRIAEAHVVETAEEARLAMGWALFLLGRQEHLVEVVDAVDDGDQAYAYLLELESDQTELLYPYLESREADVVASLLEVIGWRGDESAVPLVEEMAGSDDDVASAARRALRRLRWRFPDA